MLYVDYMLMLKNNKRLGVVTKNYFFDYRLS
jgi:hypothetical protein